jgi:hypothetical protein
MKSTPVVSIDRHRLRRAVRELASVYRELATQLATTATALERAERPAVDNYPVVSPLLLAAAIERAAVLHFILTEMEREASK